MHNDGSDGVCWHLRRRFHSFAWKTFGFGKSEQAGDNWRRMELISKGLWNGRAFCELGKAAVEFSLALAWLNDTKLIKVFNALRIRMCRFKRDSHLGF